MTEQNYWDWMKVLAAEPERNMLELLGECVGAQQSDWQYWREHREFTGGATLLMPPVIEAALVGVQDLCGRAGLVSVLWYAGPVLRVAGFFDEGERMDQYKALLLMGASVHGVRVGGHA